MHKNNGAPPAGTRTVAESFIQNFYPDEAPLFDVLWNVLKDGLEPSSDFNYGQFHQRMVLPTVVEEFGFSEQAVSQALHTKRFP